MKNDDGFYVWFKDVRMLFEALHGTELNSTDGPDWQDYYDDDYSPQEAVDDEACYW